MRTKLALIGLGFGLAAAVLPIGSASANCGPDTGVGDGGCSNACDGYDALRAKIHVLPEMECTQ